MKLRITILKYHSWYLCQISRTNHAITYTFWLNGWNANLGPETERHHIETMFSENWRWVPLSLRGGKQELLRERVIWWYFSRINCGNIVPGWLWIVLSVPGKWLIVWFPEVVDRQNSGMSWCSCYKNIVFKHKNASWVLSWSDFVFDNRILGSRKRRSLSGISLWAP